MEPVFPLFDALEFDEEPQDRNRARLEGYTYAVGTKSLSRRSQPEPRARKPFYPPDSGYTRSLMHNSG